MSDSWQAYICECNPKCRDIVDSIDYETLWDICFEGDRFPTLNRNFEHMRNIHYIVQKTHIHNIPKSLEILEQSGNLLLVREK